MDSELSKTASTATAIACAEYLGFLAKLHTETNTKHGDAIDVDNNLKIIIGVLSGKTIDQIEKEED